MAAASRRRIRTQAEWNVLTHIFLATGPTRAATRSRISSAALFVNVMARIRIGFTPCSPTRWAMRCVSTRVLPEPAPATTSSGPVGVDDGVELVGVQTVDQRARVSGTGAMMTPILRAGCVGQRVGQPALTKLAPFGRSEPGERVVAVQGAQRLQVGVDGADRRVA